MAVSSMASTHPARCWTDETEDARTAPDVRHAVARSDREREGGAKQGRALRVGDVVDVLVERVHGKVESRKTKMRCAKLRVWIRTPDACGGNARGGYSRRGSADRKIPVPGGAATSGARTTTHPAPPPPPPPLNGLPLVPPPCAGVELPVPPLPPVPP